MDLWKGYELSRTYVPAAYYTITSIKSKNGRAYFFQQLFAKGKSKNSALCS